VDLLTPDLAASQGFYSDLFGWRTSTVSDVAGGYALMASDGVPVAGIARYPEDTAAQRQARWLGLVSTDDVTAAVARGEVAGGETRLGPQRLPGRGEVAVLADPEGAVFAVIDADGGDPPQGFPAMNTLLWMELWSADGDAQAAYYRQVGGYTVSEPRSDDDIDEWHLSTDGRPRAGIVQVNAPGKIAAWLPYFRVGDLVAMVDRAVSAGGEVLVSPASSIRDGRIAVIVDPQGAAFGVVEWHHDDNTGAKQ
jgi:predicted enzyme related to lactoylglutathione lyase